jgi:hypothetical protein
VRSARRGDFGEEKRAGHAVCGVRGLCRRGAGARSARRGDFSGDFGKEKRAGRWGRWRGGGEGRGHDEVMWWTPTVPTQFIFLLNSKKIFHDMCLV